MRRVGKRLVALLRRAKDFDPAGAANEVACVGFPDQRLVLVDAALDQVRVGSCDRLVALRARIRPVLPQERRDRRQRRGMVVGIDRAVDGVARQRAEIVRKPIRVDRLALDQPGIAERRLRSRPPPVEQDHRAAAFLQVNRHAHPDDAGPQNDNVTFHFLVHLRKVLRFTEPDIPCAARCETMIVAEKPAHDDA